MRVSVQVPADGNPLSTTLPVGTRQVGLVIVPRTGAEGLVLTVKLKVALAAAHGDPKGLLVVTVIVIIFPLSEDFGVYVKEKGDVEADVGLTEPPPFSEIVTRVALPPKVLPLMVIEDKSHREPVVLLRWTVGGFTH